MPTDPRKPKPRAAKRSAKRAPAKRRPKAKARAKPKAKAAAKRRSWLWRWRRLLFLLAAIGLTAVSGVGVLLASVPLPPEAFQAESTFVFDAQGRRLAVLHGGENRIAVGLEDVPRIVRQAVLAAEDKSFYDHSGLDPVGIARATWTDIRARSAAQGGSTITQQYVKNVYVGSERSIWRKLREAALAIKLERRLTKDEILERYLNTIYFGRGAYGIQAAAKAWFDKDVTELGLPEASYLAGLIRAPETADVSRNAKEARRRRQTVLDAMRRAGMINDDDVEAVSRIGLKSYVVDRASSDAQVVGSDIGTDYFVEAVRAQLVERYGAATVFSGGLRVYTTLDLDLQRAAYDSVYGVLDDPATDPEAALVSVDRAGGVVAMVGGRDWDQSKVNLALGTAGGGGGRQAGSAFKPFTLAEAVRQGISLESSFDSPALSVFPRANNGEDWRVSNYESSSHGVINLAEATRVSSNTVYAQLVLAIGPDKVARMAERMGITADLPAISSITLGTPTVSVMDMASAYSTLARRGVATEAHLITRVESAEGNVLFETNPESRRVLDSSEADQINFVLRDVVRHGTGKAAAVPGTQVAGKTGTTQSNGDAWFVGYTYDISTAVWMGYAEGQARPMSNVRGVAVTGGSFPATIFSRFMATATARFDATIFNSVRFAGRLLGEKVDYIDPAATTTTTEPPPSTTTTEAPKKKGKGKVTSTTTTEPAVTTTTAQPTTTTKPKG